jgi:hypothetical protein
MMLRRTKKVCYAEFSGSDSSDLENEEVSKVL